MAVTIIDDREIRGELSVNNFTSLFREVHLIHHGGYADEWPREEFIKWLLGDYAKLDCNLWTVNVAFQDGRLPDYEKYAECKTFEEAVDWAELIERNGEVAVIELVHVYHMGG